MKTAADRGTRKPPGPRRIADLFCLYNIQVPNPSPNPQGRTRPAQNAAGAAARLIKAATAATIRRFAKRLGQSGEYALHRPVTLVTESYSVHSRDLRGESL